MDRGYQYLIIAGIHKKKRCHMFSVYNKEIIRCFGIFVSSKKAEKWHENKCIYLAPLPSSLLSKTAYRHYPDLLTHSQPATTNSKLHYHHSEQISSPPPDQLLPTAQLRNEAFRRCKKSKVRSRAIQEKEEEAMEDVSKLSLSRLETGKEIVKAWMESEQYENEHVKKGNDVFIVISPQIHLVQKCLDEFRQWLATKDLFIDRVEMEETEVHAFRPKLSRKKNYYTRVATSLEMCQQVLRNDQKQVVISAPDDFVKEAVGEKRKRGTPQ